MRGLGFQKPTTPIFFIPVPITTKKTEIASAVVTEIEPVAAPKPGIIPIKLSISTKKNIVHTNGKNRLAS